MPTGGRRNGHYIMSPHRAAGRRQIRAVSVDGADSEKVETAAGNRGPACFKKVIYGEYGVYGG